MRSPLKRSSRLVCRAIRWMPRGCRGGQSYMPRTGPNHGSGRSSGVIGSLRSCTGPG